MSARFENGRQCEHVKGLLGNDHVVKNGEGLRELVKRRVGSDEGVVEESGLARSEEEENMGFAHLGT